MHEHLIYKLRRIDDVLDRARVPLEGVLSKNSPNILCLGTGLENICNYDCIYCYAADFIEKRDLLSLNDYKKLVIEASKLGCVTLIITGARGKAEPLFSPKLLPLTEAISKIRD